MKSQFETEVKYISLAKTIQLSVLFFFFALFSFELKRRYWSDSEVWSIRQAGLCTQSWTGYACSWKPLFNILIGSLSRLLPDDSILNLMNMSRLLMIPIWLLAVGVLFKSQMSKLVLICYMTSSLFLFDSSVARSDFMALPFLLIHAALLFNQISVKSGRNWLAPVSALIAVLLTPKSLVVFICFAPFYFASARQKIKNEAHHKRQALKIVTVFVTTLIGCAIVVDWGNILFYFARLFQADNYGFSYWAWKRFFFIERTFTENIQIPLLIVFWFVLVFKSRVKISRRQLSGILILLVTIFFPDKLPFWISSQILIFFFIASQDFSSTKWSRRICFLLAIFAVANGVHWIRQLDSFTNSRQIGLFRTLETVLAESPRARIYDGLGLFVYKVGSDRVASSIFFGPGQTSENLNDVKRIIDENFDVLVLTHKLAMFQAPMLQDLSFHYLEVPGGVYVHVFNIEVTNPQHPGPEISTSLRRLSETQRREVGRIAIFITSNEASPQMFSALVQGHEQNIFTFDELMGLPPLCKTCSRATLAIAPEGLFFNSRFNYLFPEEFAFEPSPKQAPRESLFSAVFRR